MVDETRNLPAPRSDLGYLMQQAKVLAKSGLMPRGLQTPEKVAAALMVARDLGLGPAAVLMGEIYVTGSGVALVTRRMLAMIYQSKLVDVDIKYDRATQTATVRMRRRDLDVEYTAVWDEAKVKAAQADISPKTKQVKETWRKYRWLMKIHRAVSEAAQFVAPDIIGGCYVPDELDIPQRQVYDPLSGQVLDVEPEEAETEEPAPDYHWIDDDGARRRFWRWCKVQMSLTEDQVHEALGVESVRDFDGTEQDAYRIIAEYKRGLVGDALNKLDDWFTKEEQDATHETAGDETDDEAGDRGG